METPTVDGVLWKQGECIGENGGIDVDSYCGMFSGSKVSHVM